MAAASLVVKVEAQVATFQKSFAEATRTAQKFEKDFANTASSVTAQQKRITDAFSSFSGDKLAREASAVARAVDQIGGASKLTAAEQAKVNTLMTDAIAKYKALGQTAPKAVLDLANATKQVEQQTTLASKAAGVLGSASGQFTAANLAATAITKVTAAIVDFASKGARLQGVETSFDRLAVAARQSTGTMIAELQSGTRGLVTNLDLMTSANKAMLLGLPVTSSAMGELARTATTLGKAMGQDATKSLDDLIVALGRSSPLILDNLGLTVKVGEANEKYAQRLGITVEALTDAQKKTAFYEAAMEAARLKTKELGEQTLTLGERMSKVWVEIENNVSKIVSNMDVVLGHATESWGNFFKFLADSAAFKSWDEQARKLRPPSLGPLPFIDVTALARESQAYKDDLKAAEQAYEDFKSAAKKKSEELKRNEIQNSKDRAEAVKKSYDETREAGLSYYNIILKANLGITEGISGIAERSKAEVAWLNTVSAELTLYRDAIDSVNKMQKVGIDSAPGMQFSGDFLAGIWGKDESAARAKQITKATEFGRQMSQAIIGAIQGGGDIGRSLGAQLGTSLGEALGPKLAKAVGGTFGSTLGGMLGPLGAIAGNLLGGLVDKTFGKLFGKAGRKQVEEFASTFEGGFAGLQRALEPLGAEGALLWKNLTQGVGRNNPDQARAAIDAVTKALEKQKAVTEVLAPTFADVTAAAGRYGLEVTQIGDAINQLRVSDIAQQAIADWELMARAGADLNAVAAGMADELQVLVNESIRWGHALPEAMRPILQKMADMGLLTDDAGEKLVDLESLKFEKPLVAAIDGLITKLDELIVKITDGVGGALRGVGGMDIGGVPALARGGIVRRPTLALIGESGPEAVVPLGGGNGGGWGGGAPIVVQTYLDGRQIAEATVPHIPGVLRRTG